METLLQLFEGNGLATIAAVLISFFLAWFLIVIWRYLIWSRSVRHGYFEQVVYLVKLPKNRHGDQEQEYSVQKMREEIACAETIFASIGGLRALRGLAAWLWGRDDHFSFEIVANNGLISFYIVSPKRLSRYLEQQINAHYPDAVLEEVPDYNLFKASSQVSSGSLKTTHHFALALKTYPKQDADLMNSQLNVMSKLAPDDSLAIQYTVRSAYGVWHSIVKKIVQTAHKQKSLSAALKHGFMQSWLDFFSDLFKSKEQRDKELSRQAEKRLTALEEESLKTIEEKNSKAGLDVNLRIVACSSEKTRSEALLADLVSALSQYNYYEYGNSFANKARNTKSKQLVEEFIYRRFNEKESFLLNTEELASLFHFPLSNAETPNIVWLNAKQAAAPANVPSSGLLLGQNVFRGIKKDIFIKETDRLRHTYIIGKSGVGKSVLLANMAIQDVLNGDGICVIDPHGDLVDDILDRIPASRAEDVILFSPADLERPMGLNLLEFDPKYPEQKTFVINEMIGIFDKLYDLKATGGPIFEQYMRNAMLLIMADPESGSTLMEIPRVLADADFRNLKLSRCADQTVVDFWRKEAEKAGGDAALANVVPYITSKLTAFISNDMMRPIIAQQNSAFNFRDLMDKRRILLVSLPKGLIGEMNAYLLGMILVGKLLMASLSRADMSKDERKNFFLYIDEFQNFTTNSICQILSEARKYGLGLIIAHQYIGQLIFKGDTAIKDAVFGNAGTMVSFKIGSEDAEVLQKEFAPVFDAYDLVNVDKYTAYIKLLVDNAAISPFAIKTPWPLAGELDKELAGKIRQLSRLKYGQDRNIVESEIKQRVKINF
ncbi:MAG TPA: type IV secretion system DNA-binding domain-containing protein [bacterium]|nr:type IV secretion system DNA-binding domain-containing protein [bacterium]